MKGRSFACLLLLSPRLFALLAAAATMLWSAILPPMLFASGVLCGFPPQPEGVTVLQSRFGDGVEISYKEVYLPTNSSNLELTSLIDFDM
jgi:hypothetical protein